VIGAGEHLLDPLLEHVGEHVVDGHPVLAWSPGTDWRTVSTAVSGGGWGLRRWWLNASVELDYARMDPQVHLAEIAATLGLTGAGVGMLTAADVRRRTFATDGGVQVAATVGISVPVAAAAPDGDAPRGPGTINLLVVVPVPMADSALVNLVVTATEAKSQALAEAGVPGTGTASDAVCIACPPDDGRSREPFGGPRSTWGARAARAVHAAVAQGTADWLARHGRL
jgi:adenosylcobinamide hydrolase